MSTITGVSRNGAEVWKERAARGDWKVESAGYSLVGADGHAYVSNTPGVFGGHRRSKIYGTLDCPAALRAIARGGYVKYRVFFADEATAIATGYRPCAVCLPARYRAYKAAVG